MRRRSKVANDAKPKHASRSIANVRTTAIAFVLPQIVPKPSFNVEYDDEALVDNKLFRARAKRTLYALSRLVASTLALRYASAAS